MTLAGTVLLVDDDRDTVEAYAALLGREDGLRLLTASSGEAGLDAARIHRPDLILSDLRMEGDDGLAFCRKVRAQPSLEGTLFVLLTGQSTSFSTDAAAAGVDDVIVKPVAAEELIAKVSAMLRMKRVYDQLRADKLQMQRLHEAVERRSDNLLSLLVHIVDLSVPGAAVRGAEAATLAARMAERFEIPSVLHKDLDVAARLHEIGKLLVTADRGDAEGPEDVIEGDQWRYVVAARNLFEQTEGLEAAAELIGGIYENWDGTGHPDRLRQGQIPLRSRILRILIDYERLQASKAAGSPIAAIEQLQHHAGTRYDPLAVAYFDAIVRAAGETADWREVRMRIPVGNLEEGMELADDLCTSSGIKLLAKGAVLNAASLETILRRHRSDPIIHGAWVTRSSLPRV